MSEKPDIHMNKGLAGRQVPFEERRMWRLLLARLHPDAGGDQESFLIARALRDGLCEDLRFDPVSTRGEIAPEHFLRTWRNAMNLWATRNRDALRDSRVHRCDKPEA